ncbi:unnamed protein product [Amaranthus hypochondriacus]
MLSRIFDSKVLVRTMTVLENFVDNGTFNMRKMYASCLSDKEKPHWRAIVCKNRATPCSIICLWQAIQDRLPTLIRIQRWGVVGDATCVLCRAHYEDRDHLFKLCPFTQDLQCELNSFLGHVQWASSFEEEVSRMCKMVKRKTAKASLLTMCCAELVYHIWLQHNARIFGGIPLSVQQIARTIIYRVAARSPWKDLLVR